jgi:membrane protein DedA with SNARE-associated domain
MVFLSLMFGTLVSEDLASITAGLLIREGAIGAIAAVVACSIGILAGDIGLWAGGRASRRTSERWTVAARWLGRLPVDEMRRRLERNAPGVIIASRFLPGTRLPLYLCAGFLGVPLTTFGWWTFVAVLLWVPLLVLTSAGLGGLVLEPLAAALGGMWPARVTLAVVMVLTLTGARAAILSISPSRVAARLARWSRWEFWPMWLFYAPVAIWVAILAVRHRGLSTITAANPGIPDGGTIGESKFLILSQLPEADIIPSALVAPGARSARVRQVLDLMTARQWPLPLVLKPDVGQRGAGVRLARSVAEIEAYLGAQAGPVLVQPYHPGPFEAGVFYSRCPGQARGSIFSITDKHFPVVVGDGRSTIEQLIWAHPRYRMQADTFLTRHREARDRVLGAGEPFRLAVAGNHAQGTLFRDGMHLWTPALERRIDEIARVHPGFHVGRFDVRYGSVEAFREGRDLAIVELNGATSESTDIYDPGTSLFAAYRRLFEQWSIVFAIGAANRAGGAPVSSRRRLVELVRTHVASRVAFEISD